MSSDNLSIEAIKELWKNASTEDREAYLFDAIIALKECFTNKIDQLNNDCESCRNNYVTWRQIKWIGIGLGACLVFLLVGLGIITWKEALLITNI